MPTHANPEHDLQPQHEAPQFTQEQAPLLMDEVLKDKPKRNPEMVAARRAKRDEIVRKYNERQAQAKAKAQTSPKETTEIKKPDLEALVNKYHGVVLVQYVFSHYRVEMGKAKMPTNDKQILAQVCRDFHLKAVEGGNRLTAMPGASKAALVFGSAFNKLRSKHARRYQQQVLAKQQAHAKQLTVQEAQAYAQTDIKTKRNPMDKKKVAPENEYQKENSFLKNWGVSITGNGQFHVIGGMKGSAKGSFDMKTFAKYAGIAFEGGKLKLTLGVARKFYKALDTVLKSKKQLDTLKLVDGVTRGLKHLQSADGKSKQLGDNIRSLTGIKKGLDEMVMDALGYVQRGLNGNENQHTISKEFNQLLSKHRLPSLDHELYMQVKTQYKEQMQSFYKPSKKYPGYYVRATGQKGVYENEGLANATFWKLENGKMQSYHLNHQKK
ncbi:hypothetical protein [Microscilla marina]|uniref:Uncharacterized protein n=1 Tax=Microscilla marina ATCC 23134 TaxID=313606 RepID=A1ZTH6_MICM2|nr:hypothetical protein [Microscilla marina]EAY26236.1 hypothetical protein M23134_01557 [Microscilla marina ATCC 23134]